MEVAVCIRLTTRPTTTLRRSIGPDTLRISINISWAIVITEISLYIKSLLI